MPRGIDLSFMSMIQRWDRVLFGASYRSDVKSVDGKIGGFRVKSIAPTNSATFPTGLDSAAVDGTVVVQFPPAEVFTLQIESFTWGCGEVTSTEIAFIEYCSR